MTNTLKFRAWDSYELQYSTEDNSLEAFFAMTDDKGYGKFRTVYQRFTGSTDSAQKPIYEGDVVLWHTEDPFESAYTHKKMIVGWNQRCMQFRLYDFPNEVGEKSGEQFWAEDVRVIGHVFDYENEECRYHLDESVVNLRKPLEESK